MADIDPPLGNTRAPAANTIGLARTCELCVAVQGDGLVAQGDLVDEGEGFVCEG